MLKQKHDDYIFDELLVSLNIEEKYREKQAECSNSDFRTKAHVVENLKPKPFNFKKNGAHKNGNNNCNKLKGKNIIQRKIVHCWVCGKTNHTARDCYHRKGQPYEACGPPVTPKPQANVVTMEASFSNPASRYFVSDPELNIVFKSNDWFTDSGANVHVCVDKNFSPYYQELGTRTVSMGNGSLARVLGEG